MATTRAMIDAACARMDAIKSDAVRQDEPQKPKADGEMCKLDAACAKMDAINDKPPSKPYEHQYDPAAVEKQIKSSSRFGPKIGGKEAKMIHRLLKGRG